MAKSIIINGASYPDVPSILVPLAAGDGYAEFLENGELFQYGGRKAEKVAEYDETYTLADTSFVKKSSASTSATSIKATVSNRFTSTSMAIGDKDIVVVQKFSATPIHDGATGKGQTIKYAGVMVSQASKRKTADASAETTRQFNSMTSYILKYYNTSGAITRGQTNYGFYLTCQTPSVASATAASTTIRCSSPVLYYRASSSYETTANIKTVTECEFRWHLDAYLVESSSTMAKVLSREIDDILINGL